MVRRSLLLFLVLFGLALAVVYARIAHHDAAVLSRTTDAPLGLVPGGERELVRADLRAGQAVVFEVCSAAFLAPEPLVGHVIFDVFDLTRQQRDFSLAFDAEAARRIRRGERFGCLVLARAASLAVDARTSIVARHDATPAPDVPFAGRIVARAALGAADFAAVLFPALLALAAVYLMGRASRGEAAEPDPAGVEPPEPAEPPVAEVAPVPTDGASPSEPRGATPTATLLFAAVALGVGFGLSSWLPIPGALGGFARGLVLVVAQLATVAFVVMRTVPAHVREALGVHRPPRPWVAFLAAPVVGLALRMLAGLLLQVFPSEGRAAVEKMVSPSSGVVVPHTLLDPFSGLLAFAAVAVVAPVVEELFFRGVVYGALERARGANSAANLTALLFVIPHVPQTGGAPAALVSIALLSVVATYARRYTGSVVVPVILHFVHNASVALWVLAQNAG